MPGSSFIKAVPKVAKQALDQFEAAVDHLFEVMARPHPSNDEVDSGFRDLAKTGQNIDKDSFDAAMEEVKDKILSRLRTLGLNTEEAEAWWEPRWKKVKDLADEKIPQIRRLAKPAHLLWVKVVGGMLAVFGGAYGVVGGHDEGDRIKQYEFHTSIDRTRAKMLAEIGMSLLRSQEQMARMERVLANQTPSVVPLPPAVVAVAAARVRVRVAEQGTSQSFSTNLGKVYQAVPESREPIERAAEHGGAISSNHSLNFHGNINVTSPFGASVSLHW
jgi:hypothetical protein